MLYLDSFSSVLFVCLFLSGPINLKHLSLNLSFLKVISGNNDSSTLAEYKFEEPFVSRAIRIYPLPAQNNLLCLRMELYGCDPNPGNLLVISIKH